MQTLPGEELVDLTYDDAVVQRVGGGTPNRHLGFEWSARRPDANPSRKLVTARARRALTEVIAVQAVP